MHARLLASLLLLGGCAKSVATDATDTDTDAVTDSDADTDFVEPYNPPNPDGAGPMPVRMQSLDGTSFGYALLAKTAVTNVTGSLVTGGNVGISPAAASFVTGFSLVADATNVFATSVVVAAPGQVWAADYVAPTPGRLTTDVLAMEAAYTDAASRNPPDALNLSDGNLGGLTLAPGLYTWGTSVTIPTDVTLSGGADDVWILQISDDLDIAAAKRVVLAGGAVAEHVWWQVAGAVTIHENAHFEGVILSKTGIILQTNASLTGRAFAQTMIALDDNVVTVP